LAAVGSGCGSGGRAACWPFGTALRDSAGPSPHAEGGFPYVASSSPAAARGHSYERRAFHRRPRDLYTIAPLFLSTCHPSGLLKSQRTHLGGGEHSHRGKPPGSKPGPAGTEGGLRRGEVPTCEGALGPAARGALHCTCPRVDVAVRTENDALVTHMQIRWAWASLISSHLLVPVILVLLHTHTRKARPTPLSNYVCP
jgi:hypothetical protein